MHRSSALWRCSVSPDHVVDAVLFMEKDDDDDDDSLVEKGGTVVGNVVNPWKLSLAVAKVRNVVTIAGNFLEIRIPLLQ